MKGKAMNQEEFSLREPKPNVHKLTCRPITQCLLAVT